MAYDNPSGSLFVHDKEQFAALCIALNQVNDILNVVDQKRFDNEKLTIEIKAVTKRCFRVEVGGMLDITDEEIKEVLED